MRELEPPHYVRAVLFIRIPKRRSGKVLVCGVSGKCLQLLPKHALLMLAFAWAVRSDINWQLRWTQAVEDELATKTERLPQLGVRTLVRHWPTLIRSN